MSAPNKEAKDDRLWEEDHAEDLIVMRERLKEEADCARGEAVWRMLDREVRKLELVRDRSRQVLHWSTALLENSQSRSAAPSSVQAHAVACHGINLQAWAEWLRCAPCQNLN